MVFLSRNGAKVEYSVVLLVLTLFISVSESFVVPAFGKIQDASQIDVSPLNVEAPKVVFQQGIAGTSTIYTNGTSAKVSFAAPAPIPTYYPSDYSISIGTYFSGTVPASIQTVDTNYFIVKSSGTATSTQTYNPSGYVLKGSTAYVSGNIVNLNSNDGVYMTFRSYVSGTSTTSKTDAFIAYRSNTSSLLSYPKSRQWDGDAGTWGGENEMSSAGSPIRYVRVAVCPKSERALEKIVVTLSDDGYLDAYVFDGTEWTVTSNIGQVWTSSPSDARRPYDIVYEQTSGEALLVYGTTVAGGTNDLAYRTWLPNTGWGSEQYYDDTDHGTKITVTYVALASKPNSDEIGLVYIDSANSDANAAIWNGSAWGNSIEITGTVAITTEECVAINSERTSGTFVAVAGEDQFIKWASFTNSWSAVGIFDVNTGATGAMNWLRLAQSQNDRLMLTSVDSASDLCTALWDGRSIGNRQWSTSSGSIGSMTAVSSVTSMRFTALASKSVINILVYIQATASPPLYRFGIETSATDYLPSGTYVGGSSNYATASPAATGWLNVTLPSSAPLTAGTVYHITVRYDSGTIGASNYIGLRRMGTVQNNFRSRENTIDPWLNTIFVTTIQNREPIFVLKYSDGTYESMPYDTATAHNAYGSNWFSEKWTQNGNLALLGINIPLVKTGTPLDSLYIVLYSITDSQELATITVPEGDITTALQWYEKYFDSPVNLADGKQYRLILRSPASTSSAYYTCRSLVTGQSGAFTYDGTNSVYSSSSNGGSSWTDATTRDLTYILLSNTGSMGWVVHSPWDTAVDTNAQRCADFAWEYGSTFRNQGLLVYGTTAGQIHWCTFRAPNYMTAATGVTMGSNVHPWVQLKSNTRSVSGDVKILGVVLEGTVFDLGAVSWDGATFTVIGTTTFTADTTVITYECFDLEFQLFGDPTEFTSEVEFSGASNTDPWYQMVWTIDSAWSTGSVSVKVHLYNYTLGGYPTSSNGYDSYISNPTANIDETRTQTITTNPTHFRDSSGNWKIKVKGVKTTSTQFDFKIDWTEFKPSYYNRFTASTVFNFSNLTRNTPTQLNFTVVSHYDIVGVSVTIQIWNYSSSSFVTSGEGYLTYISAVENETKLISINSNPQFYTSSGNTKINITGILTTTTQFHQKMNQVKLDYKYSASSTYNNVLKVVNKATETWKLSLKVYDSSNVERLSNATIGFHDGSSSEQIIVRGGDIIQSEGELHDLPSSGIIYIGVSNLQASTSEISHLYVYLKILFPNTSTYSLYIITLEIT